MAAGYFSLCILYTCIIYIHGNCIVERWRMMGEFEINKTKQFKWVTIYSPHTRPSFLYTVTQVTLVLLSASWDSMTAIETSLVGNRNRIKNRQSELRQIWIRLLMKCQYTFLSSYNLPMPLNLKYHFYRQIQIPFVRNAILSLIWYRIMFCLITTYRDNRKKPVRDTFIQLSIL